MKQTLQTPTFESLSLFVSEHQKAVDTRMAAVADLITQPRLHQSVRYSLASGGKRLRAVLPWLVAKAVGRANEGHYDLGAALEIIHNFTLIHDDLIDNDDLRRGKPSLHVAFDSATAINTGDTLHSLAVELLSHSNNISDKHFRPLMQGICLMVRRISQGQQQDLDFETRTHVTEEEYYAMVAGKTAAMFQTGARMAAVMANCGTETINTFDSWGLNMGVSFQLVDDLIEITMDDRTLGKPTFSDIINGKHSLVVIHAKSQASSKLPVFNALFGSRIKTITTEQAQKLIDELVQAGSIDYVRQQALHYHQKALKCLDKLGSQYSTAILRKITDLQVQRFV